MLESIEQFEFGREFKQSKHHKSQKETMHDEHGRFKFEYKRYQHEQRGEQ